jgi:hypothetical protein
MTAGSVIKETVADTHIKNKMYQEATNDYF